MNARARAKLGKKRATVSYWGPGALLGWRCHDGKQSTVNLQTFMMFSRPYVYAGSLHLRCHLSAYAPCTAITAVLLHLQIQVQSHWRLSRNPFSNTLVQIGH